MNYWRGVGCVVLSGALLLCACRAPTARESMRRQALKAPLTSDIVRVVTYYANNPFVSFDPQSDPNPEGFKVTYYAVSSTTQKGAYGDGLIRFKMYVIHRDDPDQPPKGERVKVWEFASDEALGWRVARRTGLGWPYQFYLNWGEADPYGKEIRIVPEFVRRDGQVIRGSPKDIKVPPRKLEIILMDDPAT